RGTFTALVTPFREDAIDFTALQNLIESQIAAGIDGIIAVGTTGESPTLTHDERKEVIRFAIQTANRRCLVLAGTGSYSTREAIAATEQAEKLGVDGALLVGPYYNKPSQEGLFLPFLAAGAVGVVSVASNLLPREMCELVRAFTNGDIKQAERLHRKLYWLFKDLFIEPNPVPIKTALSWRGTISAEVRLPL